MIEKFDYKNRIMKKLKYNYKNIKPNKYSNLIVFLEDVAEFSILQKLVLRGNREAEMLFERIKNKIIAQSFNLNF